MKSLLRERFFCLFSETGFPSRGLMTVRFVTLSVQQLESQHRLADDLIVFGHYDVHLG